MSYTSTGTKDNIWLLLNRLLAEISEDMVMYKTLLLKGGETKRG